MITVFYDGKCSLCSREINYYKSIAPTGVFKWQDITVNTTLLEQHNISQVDALKSLHAQDGTGKMYSGVDAFILMWRALPYWKWLAKIVNLPLIKQLLKIIYRRFADWRFKRLKHCQLAEKNATTSE